MGGLDGILGLSRRPLRESLGSGRLGRLAAEGEPLGGGDSFLGRVEGFGASNCCRLEGLSCGTGSREARGVEEPLTVGGLDGNLPDSVDGLGGCTSFMSAFFGSTLTAGFSTVPVIEISLTSPSSSAFVAFDWGTTLNSAAGSFFSATEATSSPGGP